MAHHHPDDKSVSYFYLNFASRVMESILFSSQDLITDQSSLVRASPVRIRAFVNASPTTISSRIYNNSLTPRLIFIHKTTSYSIWTAHILCSLLAALCSLFAALITHRQQPRQALQHLSRDPWLVLQIMLHHSTMQPCNHSTILTSYHNAAPHFPIRSMASSSFPQISFVVTMEASAFHSYPIKVSRRFTKVAILSYAHHNPLGVTLITTMPPCTPSFIVNPNTPTALSTR